MNQQHEEMEEHPTLTNQAGLLRLHELAEFLSQHPVQCDKQLRQYTSVYVECHHRTQQFFITLCQHRFIILMLQNEANVAEPVCILECFNLLLTNTKQSSELVYILSQNAMHEYLFAPSILSKDTQFIQYYVQLIKTLLMKISEHEENKSLIRMFCNSKYPTFPMLTYITILAGDPNELIKVTAQQCILVLVGMINQKKIYSIYLSQPPMLVFIVRLATEFLKPGTDHEGICKYFADLMYELKNNRVPLLLLSNILCNVIIVASLPHKISVALSFIELLTKSVETRVLEHKGLAIQESKSDGYYKKKSSKSNKYYQMFEQSACDNLVIICSVYYRVIIKYITNKYVNATYLAAYIQLCPSTSGEQVQTSLPLKVSYPGIQAQCKILQDYSLKKYIDEEHPVSQVELGSDFIHDIEDSLNQYEASRQFIKLKENYLKKIGNGSKVPPSASFFGRIFNRGSSEQLNTQYIKYISDFSSIAFCKGQPVSMNIGKQIMPSTCPFISEYILLSFSLQKGLKYDHIKTGQQSESVQANEIHFNDIRSLWSFTQVNLDIMNVMTRRFIQFINSQTEVVSLVVPKLYIPPCYLFLGQLKDYLSASIHQHINKEPKNSELVQSMPMLISLSKICSLLNVQLAQTPYVSLVNQLTSLHQQLQTCLFENGFKDVVDYIKAKNKLSSIELQQKNKANNYNQMDNSLEKSGDKKLPSIKIKVKPSITFLKLCAFQCIQKIMDPHIKPLNKHFQTKWRQTFKKSPSFFEQLHEQNLSNFKVSYFGKNGCTLNFTKLIMPPTIVLRVELNNKKLLQCDILDLQGIKRNSIDNRVLQFGGGNVQNVKTETSQIGDEILEKFKQYRFSFQECVTSATLQYLAGTNETLALKGKKMRFSYSRKSNDYETPQ